VEVAVADLAMELEQKKVLVFLLSPHFLKRLNK